MSDAHETGDAAAAIASLRGLALGDGFGERWFFRTKREAIEMIKHRTTPGDQPWHWTDDTVMALGLLRVLTEHGEVEQQALATSFADMYALDPYRGFGHGMHVLLPKLREDPGNWATYARTLFQGEGSLGNGAAMWSTAEGLGDVDTTCAITGGIVAAQTGLRGVAPRWLELAEALPEWISGE